MIATIHIVDETNCKISGLDLTARKKFQKKYSFFQEYARYTPAFKLGRWDGMTSFFALGGSTYVGLLDEIVPDLIELGYSIELDDQREPTHDFKFESIDDQYFGAKVWPQEHKLEGQPITMREDQVEAVNEFLKVMPGGAIQEIATGGGKTLITAALSEKVEPYGRSVVVVPNKDLVKQTAKSYEMLGLDVGVYFGDKKEVDKTHTICTWQSLDRIDKDFRDGKTEVSLRDFIDGVEAVIVDECFDGDTLITTPQGKKPIRDLKEGDTVINLCEGTKQYKEDTIVKVHKNLTHSNSEKMLELEFDNGLITKVTANHKFLTNKGWVRADELTEDMEVIDINTYS